MPDEIWYLALIPLVLYVVIVSVLAPRWDREAPSDGTWLLALIPDDQGPLTIPPHPPHTQK